jgi:hypothetical protein
VPFELKALKILHFEAALDSVSVYVNFDKSIVIVAVPYWLLVNNAEPFANFGE